MKKRILIVLAVLVLATAAVAGWRALHREPENVLKLSGNIELNEVEIAFKVPGRMIERTVSEGDKVTKGQVIARLDPDQLLRQKEREQATLAAAEAFLAQARTAAAWQKQTIEADLSARQADVSTNQARLRELKNGSRPEEIQQAKAAVEAAEAEFVRARRDWERAQQLYKNDDISAAQYDQFRTRFETADATLKQAKERAALVVAGPRTEQVEAQAAQLERAYAGVRTAEANRLEVRRREQEILARQAEIERARAQIALIDSQLADLTAASPVSGTVLVDAAEPGEVIAAGTSIVTVGDLQRPWFRGYVGERDLGKVKLGSRVEVTSDSYRGKVYPGTITFISSEAEFTPKQIQTEDERVKLVYRIKVEVENPNGELKSNMPVEGRIVLQ